MCIKLDRAQKDRGLYVLIWGTHFKDPYPNCAHPSLPQPVIAADFLSNWTDREEFKKSFPLNIQYYKLFMGEVFV